MKNPFRRWLTESRGRRKQPPINPSIWTADINGFRCDEERFLWHDISKITIYLVDFFTYDRIEVLLLVGSKEHAITEGDNGFPEFINQLQITFPVVEESMGFLSHHAFSTEIFEFVPPQTERF